MTFYNFSYDDTFWQLLSYVLYEGDGCQMRENKLSLAARGGEMVAWLGEEEEEGRRGILSGAQNAS